MAIEQRHIIKKQTLELNLPSFSGAYAMQQALSELYQQEVLPKLSEVFDDAIDPELIIRISRLEVRLEAIPEEDLDRNFVEACLRAIQNEVIQLIKVVKDGTAANMPKAELISTDRSVLNMLRVFLKDGTLPWFAAPEVVSNFEQVLLKAIDREGRTAAKSLKQLLRTNANAIRRLVWEFTPLLPKSLLKLLSTQDIVTAIGSLEALMSKAWTIRSKAVIPSEQLTEAWWLAVYRQLAAQSFPGSASRSLLEAIVENWAQDVLLKNQGAATLRSFQRRIARLKRKEIAILTGKQIHDIVAEVLQEKPRPISKSGKASGSAKDEKTAISSDDHEVAKRTGKSEARKAFREDSIPDTREKRKARQEEEIDQKSTVGTEAKKSDRERKHASPTEPAAEKADTSAKSFPEEIPDSDAAESFPSDTKDAIVKPERTEPEARTAKTKSDQQKSDLVDDTADKKKKEIKFRSKKADQEGVDDTGREKTIDPKQTEANNEEAHKKEIRKNKVNEKTAEDSSPEQPVDPQQPEADDIDIFYLSTEDTEKEQETHKKQVRKKEVGEKTAEDSSAEQPVDPKRPKADATGTSSSPIEEEQKTRKKRVRKKKVGEKTVEDSSAEHPVDPKQQKADATSTSSTPTEEEQKTRKKRVRKKKVSEKIVEDSSAEHPVDPKQQKADAIGTSSSPTEGTEEEQEPRRKRVKKKKADERTAEDSRSKRTIDPEQTVGDVTGKSVAPTDAKSQERKKTDEKTTAQQKIHTETSETGEEDAPPQTKATQGANDEETNVKNLTEQPSTLNLKSDTSERSLESALAKDAGQKGKLQEDAEDSGPEEEDQAGEHKKKKWTETASEFSQDLQQSEQDAEDRELSFEQEESSQQQQSEEAPKVPLETSAEEEQRERRLPQDHEAKPPEISDSEVKSALPEDRSSQRSGKVESVTEDAELTGVKEDSKKQTTTKETPKQEVAPKDKESIPSEEEEQTKAHPEKIPAHSGLSAEEEGNIAKAWEKWKKEGPEKTQEPTDVEPPPFDEAGDYYVDNAGIILLGPFLPRFFEHLGLLSKGAFLNEQAQHRAVRLLHYLATFEENAPEFKLVFHKLICGLPIDAPIHGNFEIEESERSEARSLLASVVERWEALKGTSPEGFQMTFIQRRAKLTDGEGIPPGWKLIVEKKAIDILMDRKPPPWLYSMLKLPWMKKLIKVEWG